MLRDLPGAFLAKCAGFEPLDLQSQHDKVLVKKGAVFWIFWSFSSSSDCEKKRDTQRENDEKGDTLSIRCAPV